MRWETGDGRRVLVSHLHVVAGGLYAKTHTASGARIPTPVPTPIPVEPAPAPARIAREGMIDGGGGKLWYSIAGSGADTVIVPLASWLEPSLSPLGGRFTRRVLRPAAPRPLARDGRFTGGDVRWRRRRPRVGACGGRRAPNFGDRLRLLRGGGRCLGGAASGGGETARAAQPHRARRQPGAELESVRANGATGHDCSPRAGEGARRGSRHDGPRGLLRAVLACEHADLCRRYGSRERGARELVRAAERIAGAGRDELRQDDVVVRPGDGFWRPGARDNVTHARDARSAGPDREPRGRARVDASD